MLLRSSGVGAILLFSMITTAEAQGAPSTVHVDLIVGAVDTVEISAGSRVRLVATNALPGERYVVGEKVFYRDIPPLGVEFQLDSVTCPVIDLGQELGNVSAEEAVRPLVDILTKLIELGECNSSQTARAAALLASTRREWRLGPYEPGSMVILTISRGATASQPPRTWSRVLTTPSPGAWDTSYGFVFVWQFFKRPEEFFARDSANVFVITRERETTRLDFAPSVLFRFASDEANRGFSWDGLVTGFGVSTLDGAKPTLLLGSGATFWRNVSLQAGLAVAPVSRLSGKYETAQVVHEDLDENQLHENHFGINPYFGISFRFGASPFDKPQVQLANPNSEIDDGNAE